MSPISPRLSVFSYLLLLLFLWQTPSLFFLGDESHPSLTYAQTLTAPTIGEASVETVPASKISLAQWQALQAANSQNLLEDESTVEFFEKNFNLDGAYGEMNTGTIVTDWEALGKNMSTSGLALAGAYAVWRRRRLQQLKSLRAGNGAALENLFAQQFNRSQSPDSRQLALNHESGLNITTTTPLPSATPPSSNQAWQAWGKKQGLLASGGTLSALFLLWQKRQQSAPSTSRWNQYFTSFFDPNKAPSYQSFYQSVRLSSNNQIKLAQAEATMQFERENPAPVAPSKTPAAETYETLAAYNYMRGFAPYSQAIQEANAIRYDKNAKVAAVKKGLLKVWEQYFYFKSVGNTRAASAMYRNAYSLVAYSHRFATSRQKWEIGNLQAQAQYQFTRLKADYQTYHQAEQTYAPLKADFEARKASVLAAAAAPFKGWESGIWQWWQQASNKVKQAQQWLSKLNQLRAQNNTALANKQAQASSDFKQSLAQITQVFDEEAIQELLKGENVEVILPNVQPLSPEAAATQLKAKLEALSQAKNHPSTREKYEDQQARLLGYKVIRGRNGKRYYYRPYYNARYDRWEQRNVYLSVDQKKAATKQRTQVYAQKVQAAQHRLQTQVQRYQAEQFIKILKEEEPKFHTPLHQLAQFLKSVQQNQTSAEANSVWPLLSQLNQWQQTLQQQQAAVAVPNLSWAKTTALKQSIEGLSAKIQSHQAQIRTYQQASLSASTTEVQPAAQAAITAFKQSDLKNNKIYQHLETLHTQREFYKTYGQNISVLEPLKTELKAKLDSLSHLEDVSAYTHGYEFYDYQALKKDYIKLLNNQLPDVYQRNWSWYNSGYRTKRTTAVPNRNDAKLHDWYHKSLTVFNNESKAEYRAKIETRETALFAQREAEFNQQQLGALKDIFSASDIAAYQRLVQAEAESQSKLDEAEANKTTQESLFNSRINQQNQNLFTTPPSPKELAIKTLKNSDVTSITLSYQSESNQTQTSHTQTIPPQLLEPLWQSYRRYNGEWQFSQFTQEARRLTAQAKEQYKTGLIADSGLPPEPAKTKTVRDYLEDTQAFNADINKQIQTVKAGIPTLKQKFAGQAYLATALAQTEAKIKALERYRASGPVAVKEYQQNLGQWQQDNAYVLAQIETGATNHFKDLETYLSGFWQQADTIAEAKAQAIAAENIIDTRDTVETINQSPWIDSSKNPELKSELEAFIKNLSSEVDKESESFLLGNEAANSQAQIYQTYQQKFLRSQGLTWDTWSNNRVKNLHPTIRDKTIQLINDVEDELGIQLRINHDGNYRSFNTQLSLYCNSRDEGICEGVKKHDDSGDWKTNARPGESYHNYGLAVDFSAINAKGLVNNKVDWLKIANIAKKLGFHHPLPVNDPGHFEMTFGFKYDQLKEKHEAELFVDGYVDLTKTVEIKEATEEKSEVYSYNFSTHGLTQKEAENITGFSENYFQVWAKYQNHAEKTNSLRAKYIEDHMKNEPQFNISDYELYWKNLTGISDNAITEVKKVYQSIIEFSKNDKFGEINSALKYISELRKYDQTKVMNYQMAAHFATDIYEKKGHLALWGFEAVQDTEAKFGIKSDELNDHSTGFKAGIYENQSTIVVAYAGTDDLNDWSNNAKQALGWESEQYEYAAKIAKAVVSKKDTKNVIFTGHSLGGGLAAFSAALTEKPAITFNAAGVHPYTLIKEGIEFSTAEYISSFGDFGPSVLKSLLNNKLKDPNSLARTAGYFNIPSEALTRFSKDFPNITNHVTRGDILTDTQEDIAILPIALGKKELHGSVINNIADLNVWNKYLPTAIPAKILGIEYHKTYGN